MSSLRAPDIEQLKSAVDGKTILITGGASGIGLASAKLAAAAGARVVVADVGDEGRLKNAVAQIGHGSIYVRCDVTSWTQQIDMFESIVQSHGSIDIAFLNAGLYFENQTATGGPSGEAARQRVECNFLAEEKDTGSGMLKEPPRMVFDVNLFGVLNGVKLAVSQMKKQKDGGRIIATISANAYMPTPGLDMYVASKHAVLGLVRSVAMRPDLMEADISVSALCPNLTATPMTAAIDVSKLVGIRGSAPEDVAQGFAWLATNPKEYVNGQTAVAKGQDLFEAEDSYREWMMPKFSG